MHPAGMLSFYASRKLTLSVRPQCKRNLTPPTIKRTNVFTEIFRVWQVNRDNMVGFFRRSIVYDKKTKKYSYVATSGVEKNSFPIILAGCCFVSKVKTYFVQRFDTAKGLGTSAPPYRSNFFHLHAVFFIKILPNNRFLTQSQGLAARPPAGKSWICYCQKIPTKTTDNITTITATTNSQR